MRRIKISQPVLIVIIVGILFAIIPVCLKNLPTKDYYLHIIILILLYAYLSSAWNILGGYAGQHSLGNALYLGAGAYTSTYLFVKFNITPWIGLVFASAFCALLGWVIGYICFRYGLKGGYFALVTIALAEAAVYLITNIKQLGGAMGLEVKWLGNKPLLMQFDGKVGYYYIVLVLAVFVLFLLTWLDRSRFGYSLVAVRENETAAEALGVNSMRVKILANVISAILTGIGGVFFAQYFTYIHPRLVFGEGPSVQILLFSIIGGLGTIWGGALGSLILIPIAEIARAQLGGAFAGAPLLFYGSILMVVMLFMPNGFLGLLQSFYRKYISHEKSVYTVRPRER
jgi:branched-chain amino acid transport system permease protein